MKRSGLLLSALVIGSLFLLYVFGPQTPNSLKKGTDGGGFGLVDTTNNSDPLCVYVSSLGMHCLAMLGSDTLLRPGALVDYPSDANFQTRVPLPSADLLLQTCLFPSEQTTALIDLLRQPMQKTVAVPTQIYHIDRNLNAGIDLPIPKLSGLVLKAGPRWSEVTEVKIVAPQAWIKLVDENVLLNAVASSAMQKSCIDRLLEAKYEVVSKALIVKGLHFDISDRNGHSYSAKLAVDKGIIHASTGGRTDVDVGQAEQTAADTPLVLGVAFLNPSLLKGKPELREPVLYSASGQAIVSLSGSGGGGHLGENLSSAPAPLGSLAQIEAKGSESSECESGHDLTQSQGQISGILQSPTSNAIEFTANGSIRGGHYATVAPCIIGKAVGFTGHDNGVSARYFISGKLRATVRADDAFLLNVEFSGLPPQSTISVSDFVGRFMPSGDRPGSPITASGDGTLAFGLRGAGIYLVELSASNGVSVNGASPAMVANRGRISVAVE
jgi:hypothetical protein